MIPVLNRTYDTQICSIARTLEVVGERWTLLVLRDVLRGTRRFEEFVQSLGVARNVLSDRLDRLLAGRAGPPRLAEHRDCGGAVVEQLTCTSCGQALTPGEITTRPGPGLREHDPA